MSKCTNVPVFRYTWAGQDEAYACLEHATQIKNVARAFDYHLQMIPLTAQEQAAGSCSSEVKDEPAKTDG